MGKYTGKTQDAGAPILGAKFWKAGITISGKVTRSFDTVNGPCHEIVLDKPITVDGEKQRSASMGNMKGFGMALAAAGLESLQAGDSVVIKCLGSTKTGKGNPRIDFRIEVQRKDEVAF